MSNLQGSINTKINLSGELFKMGTKGYSAYEVAVQQGFKGTVDEWLASLVGSQGPQGLQGETGEKGEQGVQGIQGPKGETGDTGPTGPQGIQGEKGEPGEQGPQGVEGPQGPAGTPGADGKAATVKVGTVTTLEAGSNATVTNVGTETNAILNFGIPQGTPGEGGGSSEGGTTNYLLLENKPKINNVELTGNKTLEQLGIQAKGDYAKTSDIPIKLGQLENDSGYITIEDAVEYKLLNLEIDGRSTQDGTPTPDAPVEIKSVGYTNFFDVTRFLSDTGIDSNGTIATLDQNNLYYMPIKYGKKYIISFDNTIASGNIIYGFCDELPTIGSKCTYNVLTIDNLNKHIFTAESVSNKYLCIRLNHFNQFPYMSNVSLTEGSIQHPYIPFGKYGIEVKTVGKNLIPTNESEWEQGTIDGVNNTDSTTRLRTKNYIEINDDTLHTFRLENALIGNVWFYDEQKQVVNNLYDMIYKTGMKSVEFTTPKNTKYYKVVIRYEDNSVITSQAISEIKPMLEKGSVATEYEEHKSNTTILQLNEPLRSLPNGVKDIAYIKNNKLYVDRYVGSVVFNGSENWERYGVSIEGEYRFLLKNINAQNQTSTENKKIYCSILENVSRDDIWNSKQGISYLGGSDKGIVVFINNTKNMTLDDFKIWLSENNVQVDFELATPITEEVGECVIYTYEGVNNIDLEAGLKTEFSVTYALGMYSILPTKVSQLENDCGYITEDNLKVNGIKDITNYLKTNDEGFLYIELSELPAGVYYNPYGSSYGLRCDGTKLTVTQNNVTQNLALADGILIHGVHRSSYGMSYLLDYYQDITRIYWTTSGSPKVSICATEEYVTTAINNAIGTALGGSY